MIDDMDSLDDLVDSSVDGNARSLLLALNTDVLGQIAMFLKPADVYSLSLTCMHFKENGNLYCTGISEIFICDLYVDDTSET